jgi:hypothetical protein
MQSDEVLRTQKIRKSSFGHQTIKPRKKISLHCPNEGAAVDERCAQLSALK